MRRLLGRALVTGLACGALLTEVAVADVTPRPIVIIASGLRSPVQVVPAPGGETDRVYVVVQGGRVLIADRNRLLRRPFLDLRKVVAHGGLRGLLSLAFHPRFASNGLAYVNYVARDGSVVVAEFRTRDGFAIPSSQRVILRVPASKDPYAHFGGLVAFGPDGLLYVSIGDGGSGAAAQDPDTPLGKIVRLRVGDASPVPQVVAWGLRNPWRFSFTPSGSIVVGDVGGDRREEVDVVPRSLFGRANLGWPAFEGTIRGPDVPPTMTGRLVAPLLDYPHLGTRCYSVVGGFVYRGARFPSLRGRYVFGDLCGGTWSVRLSGPDAGRRRLEPLRAGGIVTSIVEGADREILLVSSDGGRVVRPV